MAAISLPEYRRVSDKEWRGVKVRSLGIIRTGQMEVPAGSLFTITGKYGGFDISSEPCTCCGVKLIAHRVQPHKLERV